MDLDVLHKLCDVLAGDRLAWIYAGAFPDEHTAQLITLGEEVVAFGGEGASARNRLSFILVEVYQNIVRHRVPLSGPLAQGAGRSLFVLRDQGTRQRVAAMDPLPRAEQVALEAQLVRLKGLSAPQLKELFLDRLRSEERSQRGGAGLGLIEMARRSGHGLVHAFDPLDTDHVRFTLELNLGQEAAGDRPGTDLDQLHRMASDLDLLALCRGQLSASLVEALLQVMQREVQLAGGRADALAQAFLAAAELLQSAMAGTPAPLLALARHAAGHYLVLGLPTTEDEELVLRSELANVAGMRPSVRNQHYRNALLGRAGEGAPRLGLLDLARNAAGPLQWSGRACPGGRMLLVQVPV